MGIPVTALSQSLDDGMSFIVTTKLTTNKDKDEQIDDISSIFREPADAVFVVEGIQFPCHTKVLSKRCQMLCDILSVDGDFERNIRKQRTQAKEQESALLSSSPTAMMAVAELSNVDPGTFRALLQFLYTGNVDCWEDEDEEEEDEDDEEDDDDDDCESEEGHSIERPRKLQKVEDSYRPIYHPMISLQRLLIVADQFSCQSLKHAIEYKLYDEYLYSFTSVELFVWADSHSCALLKEKAMDRIYRSNGNHCLSTDGWKMIHESKRLLGELFLYAREGCHEVHFNHHTSTSTSSSSQTSDHENLYYKVEYLRRRLSELGLDVKMNESN
jgi:hypothetical protein